MKSIKDAHGSVDVNNLSIPDAEEMIEEALNELTYSSDPGLARVLHFLAPPGYQAIVELCSENGRSKRRNAFADSWSPEEDEVRIYFERISDHEPARGPRALPAYPLATSTMTTTMARKAKSPPTSMCASKSSARPG